MAAEPTGAQELAILRLERLIVQLGWRVGELDGSRMPALEQQMVALWYDHDTTEGASFTGQVLGCSGIGLPTAAITMKVGSTTVYTGTTDASGNFSGSISGPATVTITVVPGDPHAAGFATTTVTRTLVSGPNTLAAITQTLAVGCVCDIGGQYWPSCNPYIPIPSCVCPTAPATLHLTFDGTCFNSTTLGTAVNDTLTWQSSSSTLGPANRWVGTANALNAGVGLTDNYILQCTSGSIILSGFRPGIGIVGSIATFTFAGHPLNKCSPFTLADSTLTAGIISCAAGTNHVTII